MNTGTITHVQVGTGLSDHQLSQIQNDWIAVGSRLRLPDSHWNWAKKRRFAEQIESAVIYSVVYEDRLQGTIMVQTDKQCHHVSDRGKKTVYVAFVASAPWNRKAVRNHQAWATLYPDSISRPYFVGIGRALLGVASELSVAVGGEGRLSLEATRHALDFYVQKCYFVRVPNVPVSERGLTYLELTSAGVKQFRGSGTSP